MESVRKNVFSIAKRVLFPILLLGNALIFTNCLSMKQLFDLEGIIVSKDDQVFQGESATITIDMADADKSFSFNATSKPVENGYPIKFEATDASTVRITQSASDPSKYTFTAVNSGWVDITVMCSVAYKFTFTVYVTDTAKRVTVNSLTNRRNEYYAHLSDKENTSNGTTSSTSTTASSATTSTAAASTTTTSTPDVVIFTKTGNLKVSASATQIQLGKAVTFTADIGNVTEGASYQWYTANGNPISGATGKSYTVIPKEVGTYSCYVQAKGLKSGITKKSPAVSVEVVTEKVLVSPSTKVQISAKNTNPEVGETVKIISKHSAVDEDLTYLWFAAGKQVPTRTYTNSSYEVTSQEPKTVEYYVIVTGATSGKAVTSNKLTITFKAVDHRPEFTGAWVSEKLAKNGLYMAADGKMYEMYKDDAGEWIYKPTVIATMEPTGYEFTVRDTSRVRTSNGKIIIAVNGVETSYSKSNITPRPAKYLDSTSTLTIAAVDRKTNTTAANGVPVNTTINFLVKHSKVDEELVYRWYVDKSPDFTAKGESSAYDDTSAVAGTKEYTLMVKGKISGKVLTSNKLSINFYSLDQRANFAGGWLAAKSKTNVTKGKYISPEGKIYEMYLNEKNGDWVYAPDVVARMSSSGTEISSEVPSKSFRISNNKLYVTEGGVETEYAKGTVTPRLGRYLDSSSKLVITADATTVEVGNAVKITSKLTANVDEDIIYKWYINGSAVTNNRSTNSYYEDDCPEPRTLEYYLVGRGSLSGKTLTSNKVSVTFKMTDHRPEFTGLWINAKNGSDAYTILANGNMMKTYQDEVSGEWIYKPTVEATMHAYGYEFDDNIADQKTKITDGKLNVVLKGTSKLYNKAKGVTSRAQKMISSDTKLTLTAEKTTVKVDTNVTLKSVLTNCDEGVDYQWFYDDGKKDGSDTGFYHVTQTSEPNTHTYYVVATGRTSKKTVKSNTVTIKFVMDSIRPEMAGAWVNTKDSSDAVYFDANGKVFVITKKTATDWILAKTAIAELADDSAVITEADPSVYKIWVNRTAGILYIEKNGKKAEYKQNKSIRARAGKFVSSVTSKITPALSKAKIGAKDNPATITLSVDTAVFAALDEEVSYQWFNTEANTKLKQANEPSYTYTRNDSQTEDIVVKRALRVTGKTSGEIYTTQTVSFTVEAKDISGDLLGYWCMPNDNTTGFAFTADGSVYNAFTKYAAANVKSLPDPVYFGSKIATVDRSGKITGNGDYEFNYDPTSQTLKITKFKNVKSNGVTVLKHISTKAPVYAKLLSNSTRVTVITDSNRVTFPGSAKMTVSVPELDEEVVISWYVNGTATGKTGTAYTLIPILEQAGTVIKVKAEAKGVRSEKVVSSDEISILVQKSVSAIANPAAKADEAATAKPAEKADEADKTNSKEADKSFAKTESASKTTSSDVKKSATKVEDSVKKPSTKTQPATKTTKAATKK